MNHDCHCFQHPYCCCKAAEDDAEGTVPLNKAGCKQAGSVHGATLDFQTWSGSVLWEVNLKCFHYFALVLRGSLAIKNRHCKWEGANAVQKRWSNTEPAGWVPSLQRRQAALSWYKHHCSRLPNSPLLFWQN